MKSNPTTKLNWKVALAGGVALGAGFGTISIAGADTTSPTPEEIQLHASANPSLLSLRSPVQIDAASVVSAVNRATAPVSIASPAPTTLAPSVASAVSPVSPASVASAASPVSVASAPSAASVASAPAPAPTAPAASVASPASVASVASPASVASAPSVASPASVASIDS